MSPSTYEPLSIDDETVRPEARRFLQRFKITDCKDHLIKWGGLIGASLLLTLCGAILLMLLFFLGVCLYELFKIMIQILKGEMPL